jgi:hypothetical protein
LFRNSWTGIQNILEEEGEKRKGEKENGEKLIIFIYVSDNVSFAVRHTTL